jgi:conjugal transfer pilus assembly protein TraV
MKNIIAVVVFILLTGCSSKILNPYESEFRCLGGGNEGDCISTMGAYNESIEDKEYSTQEVVESLSDKTKKSINGEITQKKRKALTPKQIYDKNRYGLMTMIVKDEASPIVVPPEVVRVLIVPYTGSDNNMYGFRYSYFFATDPKWRFTIGVEGME